MVSVFKDVIGPERVHERPMSMGGEDFSQFTRAGIRTFYYHLGTADAGGLCRLEEAGGQGAGHDAFAVLLSGAGTDVEHRRVDDEHGDSGAAR